MHFNGLFIIIPTYFIFLLIRRPRFPFKTWLYAILFSVLVYSPIILHEIKYNFSNSKLLIEKISGGSSKKEQDKKQQVASEKIVQNLRYNAGEFFLILTGEDRINTSRPNGYSMGLTCKTCKQDFYWRLSALIFYVISILILVWNLFREKNPSKKNFLIISGLWLVIGSAYFISLTMNKLYIYPRFYLVLAPLAFIFAGLIFEKIRFKNRGVNVALIIFITMAIVGMNSTKILDSFSQLGNSDKITVEVETEDVFPNYYRTPLFMHQKITDYIEQKVPDKNAKVFISSESEYEPIYWIILQSKGYKYFDKFDKQKTFPGGEYFSVQMSAKEKENDISKFAEAFDIKEIKSFGILTIVYLKPKDTTSSIQMEAQKMKQLKAVEKMKSWSDLFQK